MTKAKLANISCSECHKLTDKRKILFKLPKKTTNLIIVILPIHMILFFYRFWHCAFQGCFPLKV